MEDLQSISEVFKALSDPLRLKIFYLLLNQKVGDEYCVCDLADEIGISQPNVSHHLKILKSVGLLRCEKSEGCSFYVVDKESLKKFSDIINNKLLGGN